MTTPKFYQHLKALNDINGNPQRLYVVYDDTGNVVSAHDEGYSGLPKECKNLTELPDIDISQKTYRQWRKKWSNDY